MDGSEKKDYLQYHPGACAALELELREDADRLEITSEKQLNKKPNQIDILVIRKEENAKLRSGLAAIFKKINLWEYKNPNDQLGERVYYRSHGYAGLYLAYLAANGENWNDVTLSFMREAEPKELLSFFRENGFRIKEKERGIYHIKKEGHVDMQVIVTRCLDPKQYHWLTKLTQRIERTDLISMGDDIRKLRDPEELIKAEAVYDLMYRMNKDNPVFKEESVMSGIRDLFAEEFKMHEEKEKDLEKKLAKSEKERAKSEKELARERKRIKELEAQLASQKMGSKAL